MTRTNTDTTTKTKLQKLYRAKSAWERAVTLLEEKIKPYLDPDTHRPRLAPDDIPNWLQWDLNSLRAGRGQVDAIQEAIDKLEKKETNKPCNTPTNTTPPTPTTPSSLIV